MPLDTCPNVQNVYTLGDTRVNLEHLGKVLAAKFQQRFSGVDTVAVPAPEPQHRGRLAALRRALTRVRA